MEDIVTDSVADPVLLKEWLPEGKRSCDTGARVFAGGWPQLDSCRSARLLACEHRYRFIPNWLLF